MQAANGMVNAIQAKATKLNTELVVSSLNVPTTNFVNGFALGGGTFLKDANQNLLTEYFSFHLTTTLQLQASDAVGNYQLAMITDDGAVLGLTTSGNSSVLINADGSHASRLDCATQAVNLSHTVSQPLVLDYYQGPRYYFALTMLWRPLPANPVASDFADTQCGQYGDTMYWDATNAAVAPVAQPAWSNLLTRGWKVIPAANFALSSATSLGACAASN
jgi:hypothetical protein